MQTKQTLNRFILLTSTNEDSFHYLCQSSIARIGSVTIGMAKNTNEFMDHVKNKEVIFCTAQVSRFLTPKLLT